jgi:nicotinate-nucleotide adenylyltransferase
MPAAVPPHKEADGDPGAGARLEMCRLAAGHDPRFSVSSLEVERGGASYTADTLRELHEKAPGDDLTFIVGGDIARSLPAWREPAEVVRLARLGIAEREGALRADIVEALAEVPGAPERVEFFDLPRVDVSSSLIRRRVADGRPIRFLVPDAVDDYIAARGLYRSAVGIP